MITLAQLVAPQTQDELLAQLVQALKGVGFVRHTGTGTGRMTASGLAQGNYAVVVEITTTGERGVAQYRTSLDGGATWSAAATIPTVATALTGTGATLTFVAGPTGAGDSFVALDRHTFYVASPTFGQTAWQQFSWHRRILELEAEAGGDVGALVASLAAGGYLDNAAGEWLDLYASNVYDEERKTADQAIGICVLEDVGGSGPYSIAAGQLWAANEDGTLRWVNTVAGVLPASGTLKLEFAAEFHGAAHNAGNGAITQLLTPLPGVTISNPARVGDVAQSRVGAPPVEASATGVVSVDSDVRIEITTGGIKGVALFRYSLDGGASWAATSQTVPFAGLYALGATGLSVQFSPNIAHVYLVADVYTFTATVSWLSQAGVDQEGDEALRERCRKKWATLAVGRTDDGFEYWALTASKQVTRAYARESATVPGLVELFLAGPDGAVAAGVVTEVDTYVQPRCPLTTTCAVASAGSVAVALAGTVYVRMGLLASAKAAAEAALGEYLGSVPIGGVLVNGSGLVSREVLLGCLTRGSPQHPVDGVLDVSLTSPGSDVVIGATQVPVLDVAGLNWVET